MPKDIFQHLMTKIFDMTTKLTWKCIIEVHRSVHFMACTGKALQFAMGRLVIPVPYPLPICIKGRKCLELTWLPFLLNFSIDSLCHASVNNTVTVKMGNDLLFQNTQGKIQMKNLFKLLLEENANTCNIR